MPGMQIVSGHNLTSRDTSGMSDPYAVVILDGVKKKTKVRTAPSSLR